MTEWIYESPNCGKTIYRRPIGRHTARERLVALGNGDFVAMDELIKMAENAIKEQCLRHEHPNLRDLWDSYQTMKRLVQNEIMI